MVIKWRNNPKAMVYHSSEYQDSRGMAFRQMNFNLLSPARRGNAEWAGWYADQVLKKQWKSDDQQWHTVTPEEAAKHGR